MKYISIPDLHNSPDWRIVSDSISKKILDTAKQEGIDFALIPGDLYDRPLYASDKGGANDVIRFIEDLSEICPIVAIEGTPSHDARGSYYPLNVTVLEPGSMYGLYQYSIVKLSHNGGFNTPEVIFFGFPEITKDFIQASNPKTSADEVNALAVSYMSKIISEHVAPIRAMVSTVPAIGIFHGNVSDSSKENETDPILKASDIVIKTDVLKLANLDRWELGHLHTPWESSKINAGYAGFAGIDKNPWGKTGFVPSFNLGTIDKNTRAITIERIPYGTPMRIKIDKPLDFYDPSIAYWLESSNPSDVVPHGHPWNRITYKESATVSRRVETNEMPKTLHELARVFDPEITDSMIDKIKEIELKTLHESIESRSIELTEVEIIGSKFWDGKTVKIDISKMREGLTQLSGANGSGKSSLVGFCTPYPCFIGKDTESGRMSALKDFFQEPVSAIRKTIRLNGKTHEHIITIRGAHTKTPKVECFLSIDGVPALEKSSFDEMMDVCEELYGPLSDYLMTSFYVQPLQGKSESGLMTASMSTVRDLVQRIAGIDRSGVKEYAHDQVIKIQSEIDTKRMKIDAALAELPDAEEIYKQIKEYESSMESYQSKMHDIERELESAHKALDFAKIKCSEELAKKAKASSLDKAIADCRFLIESTKAKADEIRIQIAELPVMRDWLDTDAKAKAEYDKAIAEVSVWQEERSEYELRARKKAERLADVKLQIQAIKDSRDAKYNLDLAMWMESKATAQEIAQRNELAEKEISLINPCPKCGYIDPDSAIQIESLRSKIKNVPAIDPEPLSEELNIPESLASELAILLTPELDFNNELKPTVPKYKTTQAQVDEVRSKIEKAIAFESTLQNLVTISIPESEHILAGLISERSSIILDTVDISTEQNAFDNALREQKEVIMQMTKIETTIEHCKKTIKDAAARKNDLLSQKELLDIIKTDLSDWIKIEAMLSPSKLPAMELEAFLDSIDREATRMIQPYREGRYSFKTLTQKGEVDRFDIRVHDAETGNERSFLQYSVGEKSFFNDAYVKALVRVRKTRMRTCFSPIIIDEADSFIEIPMIPQYYEMQRNYYTGDGLKAIIITHSPDAGNYIENAISMMEVIK